MEDRPRLAVLVYGSLLAPTELEQLFDELAGRVWPVRLQGFERICNQTASWRPTDADQQAVLNVVRNSESWCNALIVTDLHRSEFEGFRDRERGYRLVEVGDDRITPYPANDVEAPVEKTKPPLDEQDLTLVTTGTKVAHDIAPIPSYCRECLDGASQWGERFLTEFKTTTTPNPGTDLPAEFRE
ncbi:hypothetical protein [Haloarcula salinisoli]|uniref:AIG2-like family protein n=1 Tax=Haloarcula salinisoli TaxID=2487746 RepID=A0A8J7YMI4_9EURY|nr:hypothetical protein [Halomicroarcula salinisoli]MBX0288304.1 hypothetical protein [Halomicroarcula salinisoli]MBX0305964.1 hypothetical protein [Halomicroarcula salinisoli]